MRFRWGGWGKLLWCDLMFLTIFIYLAMPGLSCSMQDLVPWPEIEPGPPALRAWNLNHWTTREVPEVIIFKLRFGGGERTSGDNLAQGIFYGVGNNICRDSEEGKAWHFSLSCIGEGNGNPLQCSCLENPRDGGAWWASVCGVTQSRTRPKQLSSSSSSL